MNYGQRSDHSAAHRLRALTFTRRLVILNMRKKANTKKKKKESTTKYTHRDGSGMAWRMSGSRPISALADRIMRECGLPTAP
jgi:hypothetical protein